MILTLGSLYHGGEKDKLSAAAFFRPVINSLWRFSVAFSDLGFDVPVAEEKNPLDSFGPLGFTFGAQVPRLKVLFRRCLC